MTDAHADDAGLLAELGRVVREVDPVPSAVREASVAAFTWRLVDEELAQLSFDSTTDDALVATRGDLHVVAASFSGDEIEIEIELSLEDGRRLVGSVHPVTQGTIALLTPEGEQAATTIDDGGRFWFDDPPTGPVSLRLRSGDGQRALRSAWIIL